MEFTQLSLTATNARATLTLNGFPVANTESGALSMPIDLYLLETNTLTLTVTPEQTGHILLRIETAAQGEMVDTSDASPGLVNLDEDVTAEKTYTLTFNTPGKHFGKRFLENPLNQQQALDYARTIAQLIQNKDYDKLAQQFQPKFEDYATLYQITAQEIAEDFKTFLQGLTITLDPNAITTRPHCQGRVYQLLHNNDSFITVKQGDGEIRIDVYIANVNGLPKVIR